MIVSPRNGLFLCVGFDEGGCEGVTQDEVEVPFVWVVEVEEVEKIEGVEKVVVVVDFVRVQGEHIVEFGIEREVVEEMEVEEMEEEEGMGLASVLVPVEGEAVEREAERHWRALLRGRQCRVALCTSF